MKEGDFCGWPGYYRVGDVIQLAINNISRYARIIGEYRDYFLLSYRARSGEILRETLHKGDIITCRVEIQLVKRDRLKKTKGGSAACGLSFRRTSAKTLGFSVA